MEQSRIQKLCITGVMCAAICILSPIAIPMPLGVPLTLQTFIIAIAGIMLGGRQGMVATALYLLVGAIGIPVFSNFTGGYQCLIGPTGGFLLSFPLMAYIIGKGAEYMKRSPAILPLALILGNLVNMFFGTLFYCLLTKTPASAGIAACVLPFLPAAVIKIILTWMLGPGIKRRVSAL